MKNYLLIALLFVSVAANSQNLELNIPSNASIVFEINSPGLTKAVPFAELEKSSFGKKMIAELSKMFEKDINSFDEIGINPSASSYIFLDHDNNQSNLVYLFPIKDKNLIRKVMEQNQFQITDEASHQVALGGGQTFFWNDNQLTVVQFLNGKQEGVIAPNYFSPAKNSISSNLSYKKHQDEEATFSFWIDNISNSLPKISGQLGKINNQLNDKMMSSMYDGYESLSMKLFLQKSETRLTSELSFNERVSSAYQKISKQKYNSEFFEYVDLKNCLGYFSSNVNITSLLTEYPTILRNQLIALPESNKYKDEIDLGLTLFSTLLDEDAIGELIKGDMLFVLSDLSEKEVEYTAYEYDSAYNSIEVIKTKTEKVPDFISMASVKEGKLSKQLISYLLNKKVIEQQDGFYKIGDKSMPVDVFFMIKNDILFIGTSVDRFRAISTGKFKAKVPSNFRTHIEDNQIAFYAGVSKAESSISASDFPNDKIYTQTKNLIKGSPDVYMTAEKFQNNSAKGTVVIKTPKGYDSGLTYLLHVFEELKK